MNTEKAIYFYNLGTIQKNQGNLEVAISFYKKSIKLNPNLIPSYNNLALILIGKNRLDEAIKFYKNAIKINSKTWDLYYNLGNIYLETGKYEAAITNYKKAIKYNLSSSEAYANLGISYFMISNKLAMPTFKKAIKLSPGNIQYYYTLAYIYEKAGDLKNAIYYYEKTIEIDPNYEFALSHLFSLKRTICDWAGLEKIEEKLSQNHKESPWASILRTEDLESNLIAGKNWSEQIEKTVSQNQFKFNRNSKEKIRLGYISGHFGNHPVNFTTSSVFKHHDRSKFEVFVYSYGPDNKTIYKGQAEDDSDHFTDLSKLSNKDAARKIYEDKIEVLIDLSGFTEGNRAEIMAQRPSPIQMTWAGLSASTGSNFIDYFIADKIIVPETHEKYYSEKILYLSPCFCPIQNIIKKGKKRDRKYFGLPENKFVYAVFNQNYKIDKELWKIWMEVLKATDSVIWIIIQNEEVKKNLIYEAVKQRVDKNRIFFTNQLSIEDFYENIPLANLTLDTKVYGGGTTTYLSLLKKVPVITLKGAHPASSFTSSILESIGLSELSTKSLQDYKNLSIRLAKDKTIYTKLRSKININIILDAKKTTRDLEKQIFKVLGVS